MSKLNEKIREAKERSEEAKRSDSHEAWLRHYREREATFEREAKPFLRPAFPLDYRGWLEGFVEAGGMITHYYDYPLPNTFYVAVLSLKLPDLHGAASVNIIVPEGIKIAYEGLGHNSLFFMDLFTHTDYVVPVYNNI